MSAPTATLIATKLAPPALRTELVPRAHLVERLNRALVHKHKLALVSAPAGFGKTTLVREWCDASNPAFSAQGGRFAWLTLDDADNDPSRFVSYFFAAAAQLDPSLGNLRERVPFVTASESLSPEAVMAPLINGLAGLDARPRVLVLDDLHTIYLPAIQQLLQYWLDHAPPHVLLAITTRADPPLPLARLRARDQMTELRANDLRFTKEQAAAFLNRVMGLDLSPAQVSALESRTEGWIAGLQLAALSMQGRTDIEPFLKAFTGSNRYVIDYLAEEVLRQQSPEIRSFLIQTSILERLGAELCAAVIEPDSISASPPTLNRAVADLLQNLERANLFVSALDAERRWFRYHKLFADVLQSYLAQELPERVPALHHRASKWFQEHGWIDQAIMHALRGWQYEDAARLIVAHGLAALVRGEQTTVERWLGALSPELWEREPRLYLVRAVAYAGTSAYGQAKESLLRGMRALEHAPEWNTPTVRAEFNALLAAAKSFLRETDALPLIQSALRDLPPDNPHMGIAQVALGNALFNAGELEAAHETLEQTIAAVQDDVRARSVHIGLRVTLILVLLTQGKLRAAAQSVRETHEIVKQSKEALPSGVSLVYAEMGAIAYERNELAQAQEQLEAALSLVRTGRGVNTEIIILSNLAQVLRARGDHTAALDTVQLAETLASQSHASPATVQALAARRVQIWLEDGNLVQAAAWADQEFPDGAAAIDISPFSHHLFALADVYLARHAWNQALVLAENLYEQAAARGYGAFRLSALQIRALAHAGLGENASALELVGQALELAAPEDALRSFLNRGEPMRQLLARFGAQMISPHATTRSFLDKVLSAFPTQTPTVSPAAVHLEHPSLLEPISQRELEVLRYIAQGLSNREIADAMVVTLATVKKHINNLYTKLGVASRTRAILRGRELGLLG